jgi:UDP-N-acetyl-D-glucosamine dehydrogenase
MSPLTHELDRKISQRAATIGICGLGYVGLPLVRAAVRSGFPVIGFDIDEAKTERLRAGRSYIGHIPNAEIEAMNATGRFDATTDFGRIADVDIVLICVPTPLSDHREPDLSYVAATAEAIAASARAGQLIVLESTTYPGTTAEVVAPIFVRHGFKPGEDVFLAYSPEREDPGNSSFNTATIPKIVGGETPEATQLAAAFYGAIVETVIPVSNSATAEAVKLTENIFRAVNIALVNELKVIFTEMNIDIWEVINAAKTKPFGFMPFYPGPGLGGHCIPIDPFYLTWKAREYGVDTRFVELSGQINNTMPRYVVDRLRDALDHRFQRGLNGTRILVIGVAYKKNVDDIRESPSLRLIELLEQGGSETVYHDPYVAAIGRTRDHPSVAGRTSQALTPELIGSCHAVLIATDHDAIDYATIADHARLIVDTRNVFGRLGIPSDTIIKA